MRNVRALAVLVVFSLLLARDARAAAVGEPCTAAVDCASGTCLPAIDDPQVSYCTSACTGDDDCPGNMSCKPTTDPDVAVCVHLPPTPGAVGWPCTEDAACAASRCAAIGEGGGICTRACIAFGGADCPLGFTCQDFGQEHLCLPARPREGCAIAPAGGGRATLVAFAALVVALILARTWPRRRSAS